MVKKISRKPIIIFMTGINICLGLDIKSEIDIDKKIIKLTEWPIKRPFLVFFFLIKSMNTIIVKIKESRESIIVTKNIIL